MDEVKKYLKMLQADKFQAGPDSNSVTKGKGKKLWLAEDLMDELRKRGADARSAFGLAEAVIEEIHREKTHLRERNEAKHKNHYIDLLESGNGMVVRETCSQKMYVTDVKNWHSTEFTLKSLEMGCKASDVDMDEIVYGNLKLALFDYEPYRFEKVFNDGNDDRFNTFVPPLHFFNYQANDSMWPTIKKFFDHFFVSNVEYEYVLDWLASSLYKKNNIFLLLPAEKGVGKNFFAERILLPLYGPSNFSTNRNEDIKSKFNAEMANKQCVVVDEFTIDGEDDNDRMKIFTNNMVTVEEKFQARQTKKISCNIVLFTNRFNRLRLETDQRRYSVLPLTDLKLDDNAELLKDFETINDLGYRIEQEIPAFYKFLRNRKVLTNMNTPRVNQELMSRIHFESQRGWEAIIRERIEEMDISTPPITVEDLRMAIEEHTKIVPGIQKIVRFVKGLKDICQVSKGRGNKDMEVTRI